MRDQLDGCINSIGAAGLNGYGGSEGRKGAITFVLYLEVALRDLLMDFIYGAQESEVTKMMI